jgi:hypothetical protein
MHASEMNMLWEIHSRIDAIDRLAREIEILGAEIPAVAKNARVLLAVAYAMKFGVSDLVEPYDGA